MNVAVHQQPVSLFQKIKWGDIVVFIGLAALVGWTSWLLLQPDGAGDLAVVHLPAGDEKHLSLSQEGEFTFEGREGPLSVKVEDHNIRVIQSSCRNKICVQTGAISKTGEIIVCAPNQIWITIEGQPENKELDAVSH